VNTDPANAAFTYPFPLHWKDSWTGTIDVQYDVSTSTAAPVGFDPSVCAHGTCAPACDTRRACPAASLIA
jgi:hypothetical protein